MRRLAFVYLVLFVVVAACKKEEQVAQLKGDLAAIVHDEFGNVIEGAMCEVIGSGTTLQRLSTVEGKVNFTDVPAGDYQFMVSKQTYLSNSQSVTISPVALAVNMVLKAGATVLTIGDSVFVASIAGGFVDINVKSNVRWVVSSSANWVKPSANSGTGNKSLRLGWDPNTGNDDRSAIVSISAGSVARKVRITQLAQLRLLYTDITHNAIGRPDSVVLTFNKTFSLKSITGTRNTCTADGNALIRGKRLAFAFQCGGIAFTDYNFSVSIQDGSNPYIFSINVKTGNRTTKVKTQILDYFISEDGKTLWATGTFPNSIIKVSLPDLTVDATINLDYVPSGISWNRFKHKLNVFYEIDRCYFDDVVAGHCRNFFSVMDPVSFTLTNTPVPLIPGYDADTFGYPYVFPMAVCLFDDGKGVAQLRDEYNYRGWRSLDATNNDATFIAPLHNSILYQEMYENFDATKIYMMQPDGASDIDIYAKGASSLTTYHSPVPGRGYYIRPSPKADLLYHAQLFQQFITNTAGYVSHISLLDPSPFYGGTAFSQRLGEEETIFFLGDGRLQLLDYKTATTLLDIDTPASLEKIKTTPDGKYLIGLMSAPEGGTQILAFDINELMFTGANSGGRMATRPSAWVPK
jgi:hypothetical protein